MSTDTTATLPDAATTLRERIALVFARRVVRLFRAWRPGTVVCLQCERAIPIEDWQARDRCPHCRGIKSWAPRPEDEQAVSATIAALRS